MLESNEYDFRYHLGVAEQTQNVWIDDKEQIVLHTANHFAIFQVKGELDQILCGPSETLETLIRSDPTIMRSLFVPSKHSPLSADSMFDLFMLQKAVIQGNMKKQSNCSGTTSCSLLKFSYNLHHKKNW